MGLRLIIGGARSGKSARAQALAEAQAQRRGGTPVMIATAEALDEEMRERIARHRAERGPAWRTLEAPLDLAAAIAGLAPEDCAVVDCLTLWLSNLMFAERSLAQETDLMLEAADHALGEVIFVTNEVGMSIVPENALARRFRDEAGRMNRRVAERADEVEVMFAGVPLRLKP
ncbi:MAG TPA: bifunctional adenosylcobinamide kinase/adenosylcobinamide-phosphate guanylyltransferase [Phenylobacterium sp.]|uniref:bifunctional adenosylcobinamide kinase/adenosylcobinamide-phosphate guanylyltransferase n=1 Tax=Phenylobacterium sp. TaxID=1871053 RepID=UPI002B49CC34|nr:bifunctional adenosylcobinamide kinase/adenosylcobinamide-phosphate guanylyltransferase [Phenylobacterium sp.]HKR89254.1 bifunctional adenosylcobinamide kinase/adenosylcobinamide-phosphate guanylyltransferase [Phenylobacterium sp.]